MLFQKHTPLVENQSLLLNHVSHHALTLQWDHLWRPASLAHYLHCISWHATVAMDTNNTTPLTAFYLPSCLLDRPSPVTRPKNKPGHPQNIPLSFPEMYPDTVYFGCWVLYLSLFHSRPYKMCVCIGESVQFAWDRKSTRLNSSHL